jgi:hypothetical protein
MKTHLILPVILILFICQSSCSQVEMPQYPKYKDVVNQFFTRYTTKGNTEEARFVFAKKPDGWHAMLVNYQDNKVVKDELYWSRRSKQYLEIGFPHYVQAEVDPNRSYLQNNSWAIASTELNPYWGYDGWEMDVIKEFAGKRNLPDSLINAVARAYSSYSRSFTDYTEFGNPENFKTLPKGQNSLNQEKLAKYLENQHLAIETYYKLYKQNPKFESFVSDSYNVYSNEIMNTFLTLRYFQNEETAQKELKKELYDPFYKEMARNYLNSCDKDAILFTNGDMDTYPLLYVQEAENFRKDVLIVNLSLLNLGRYINHLATFKAGAKPLKLGLNPDIYKSESKQIFYIQEKLDKAAPIKEIIDFVLSTDEKTKIKTALEVYDYIPTRDIYFKIDQDKIKKEFDDDMFLVDSSFNIHLTKNYLDVSGFCVLDIIASNNFERPIYFALTVGDDEYSLYKNYLCNEAFGLKISPIKYKNSDKTEFAKVYVNVLYDKLFNQLKFDKNNYKSLGIFQKRVISNYRRMFSGLASQYIVENNMEKAQVVLDRCMELFPAEVADLDYYTPEIIENYFKIKQDDKAKSLLTKFLNQIYKKLEKIKKENNKDKNNYESQMQLYLLNYLLNVSGKFIPNDQITKDLQVKFDEYRSLTE